MNKKNKIICLSAGVLSIGVGVGVGLLVNEIQKQKYIPIPQRMANSLVVSTFINNFDNDKINDFISKNDFKGSLKLIGNNGKPIPESVYSMITVNEAYKNNFFKFEIPNKVKTFADEKGITVYIKNYLNDDNVNIFPSENDSSTPTFRIWFSKGKGKDFAEDFITFTSTDFYFKKTSEENSVKNVESLFKFKNGFSLKEEFYDDKDKHVIKQSIFAKNIKDVDIISNPNLNLTEKELDGVNWKITELTQDPNIPSKLKISVNFYKGKLNKNYFSINYQSFEIDGFGVEQGVDDPKSKVDNFIENIQNKNNIGESFVFNSKSKVPLEVTVNEAYEEGLFSLDITASMENEASRAGVEYVFKLFDENNNSHSAFPNENDSQLPKFKIFVKACFGIPLYENFFVVEGSGQVTNAKFKETESAKYILDNNLREKIDKATIDASGGIFDPYFNKIKNQFTIPASIIAGIPEAYKNLKLKLVNIQTPQDIKIETKVIEVTSPKIDILEIKAEIRVWQKDPNSKDPNSFINMASFEHNFDNHNLVVSPSIDLFTKDALETTYNTKLIEAFKKKIGLGNGTCISTHKPINKDNANNVLNTFQPNFYNPDPKHNYYFNNYVYVEFGINDVILGDPANNPWNNPWIEKPTFEIDFSSKNTTANMTTQVITFEIKVKSNGVEQSFNVSKNISSFY